MIQKLQKLWADESGLVSALEMPIGVFTSMVLIVVGLVMILAYILGMTVTDAVATSAQAGALYVYPAQSATAVSTAQQLFNASLPQSSTLLQCVPLKVTTPTTSTPTFAVSTTCTVNMGMLFGYPITASWSTSDSIPVGPYAIE